MIGEFQVLSEQLALVIARNSATEITDRLRLRRAQKQDAATIAELEEIVNELIDDKSELIRIAHAFEENLVAQRLSELDVKYIADHVIPIVSNLAELMPQGPERAQVLDLIEKLQPLVSTETITILQVLGVNLRKSLGEPLTNLIRSLIEARAQPSGERREEIQTLQLERESLIFKVALDPGATARFQQLLGHSPSSQPS